MIIVPSNVVSPAANDPFFSNTVLLLKTIGVGGATNNAFRDDSPNNFVPTRVGDVTQGAVSPYFPTGYWSVYFGGDGSRIEAPANSAYHLTTNDFTFETWINTTQTSTAWVSGYYVSGPTNGLQTSILLYLNSSGIGFDFVTTNGADNIFSCGTTAQLCDGKWHHVAASRSGGMLRTFRDGILVTETYFPNQINIPTYGTPVWRVGGVDSTYERTFRGRLSNMRLVNGSSLYNAAFTPLTQPLAAVPNTVLLALQNNRFRDNSVNNATFTATGSNVIVERFSPFPAANRVTTNVSDSGSVTFDGSGDYMTVPHSGAFNMGTEAFTAEFWMNPAAAPTGYAMTMISSYNAANQGWEVQWRSSPQAIRFGFGDFALIDREFLSSTYVGRWTHVAVSREANGNTRMFFNGVQQGATVNLSTAALNSNSSTFNIGLLSWATGQFYNGFLSNVRVVKGSALYTSDFTPSTTPLTAITGTSLLTCQSAQTVTDASTNNFTVTRLGDAKASEVSPFKRSSLTYCGSAYFSGTGDLRLPSTSVLSPGTADFTVEGWVNMTAVAETNGIFQISDSGYFNGVSGVAVQAYGLYWYTYANGDIYGGTVMATLSQWYHFALVRNNGTTKLYVNGVAIISYADTRNYTGTFMGIGNLYDPGTDSRRMRGYMSNFRYVRGTAVYTANFTPPTAPVTAINGTALLLNFDNAGMNDVVASGNFNTVSATTSTNVTKYAAASTEFAPGRYLLSTSPVSLHTFAVGDFCIEAWVNITSVGAACVIWDQRRVGGATQNGPYMTFYVNSSGRLEAYVNAAVNGTGSTVLGTSVWRHVAICRSGTTTRMFLDGVQDASWSDSTNYGSGTAMIGWDWFGTGTTGTFRVEDLRVTRFARYTSNFTPPALSLPES